MKIKSNFLLFAICYLLFMTAAPSYADMGTQAFRDMLAECDGVQAAAMMEHSDANDMNKIAMDASNCYIKTGNAVIKKYYTQTAEDTGKKFTAFANAIHAAAGNIYMGPDECYPECGHIANNLRMGTTERHIKQYVIEMLDYVDSLDI